MRFPVVEWMVIGTLFASPGLAGESTDVAKEKAASEVIQPGRISAHVKFLASDLLEGRGTGTRGYDIAAAYVAAEFASMGLIPAGDARRETYLQKVPLRKTDLVRDQCSLVFLRNGAEEVLSMEKDFLMSSDYLREQTSVEAAVVFAGYGVTAPDLKYDDYSGIDAAGKVVAILAGAPSTFPNSERAHYSSSLMKERNAVAHGAIGVLTLRTPDEEERSPWERSVRQSKLSGYRWLTESGEPHDVFPQLRASASLSRSGAELLFAGAPTGLNDVFELHKQKKMSSFPLPVRVRMQKTTRFDSVDGSNVAGLLEGSDPMLKNEVVVYTAHLDHLGIGPPVNGDAIYNGAYDNAMGTAFLLELAQAFAVMKEKPRRSILFLAVTGEEKGLQGSGYFANYPTVPGHEMVADINMDMLLLLFPLADAVAIGAEHSTLGPVSERALSDVGLMPGPDPAPEEVVFVRSDQYSFIRQGVPSIFLVSGYRSSDPSVDARAVTKRWLQTIYHSPQDDMNQPFDWASGVKLARAGFLIGLRTANAQARPAWNAGDFFGVTFASR